MTRSTVRGRTALRLGITALAVTLAVPLTTPAASAATPAERTPALRVSDGATQPVFSRAEAIRQVVDIETETDSDLDGVRDRVRMRILRPKETDAGLKVATIVEASPYWGGGNDVPFHPVDVDEDGLPSARLGGPARRPGLLPESSGAPTDALPRASSAFPGYTDNYFLPRGYAVAQLDSVGTGGSTGCPTSGGRNETLGAKAAVDWLNGRARGWDPAGEPVGAAWSTGDTAMMGISYNGTLPTAVAATGVEGLKAIVPVGAISSWYDYYRANGAVVAPFGYQGEDADILAKGVYSRADREICRPVLDRITAEQDRVTGDWSRFWSERDYLKDAHRIRAAVFAVHGTNDWNVKTGQVGRLWERLAEHDVPRKLWLHRAGHNNPMPLRMEEWLRQLQQWFDHWLYGLDSGALDEPAVDVEQADFTWRREADWPAPGTRGTTLRLGADGGLGPRTGPPAVHTLTDAGRTRTAEELVTAPATDPGRLAYTTGPLRADVRLSGAPRISLRTSLTGTSPSLTALLVDYGRDTRAIAGVTQDTSREICYGQGVPGDTGCAFRTRHRTETADFKIVTRGWTDLRNRHSIAWQSPVREGREYRIDWGLEHQDYVFKKGHRIGVVLLSADHQFTLRHPAGTRMSVRTGVSSITLPLTR
ncbi:Xaa-Pro dipeptidyl-peptidase [Streptomyces sp. NPDC057638]|uniref:Xaa-Pro dipeptidyl-peptidase n=1 Tax=Streptomyces sp. NPDC057638 TaxID=3346190 RepID=UPI0036A454C4